MELDQERGHWEEIATQDPFWAVLAYPDRKYGRWDPKAFFSTGESEIDEVMRHASTLGHQVGTGAALDFGSGVGRLTRALARRFDRAVGVDISQTMIDNATKLNADVPNCSFQVNVRPDLQAFGPRSFDLVNTRIVLQHLPDRATVKGYLAEFLRVLRDDGLLVFQLPSALPLAVRLQPRRNAYLLLRRFGLRAHVLYWRLGLHPNRMIAVPRPHVIEFLEERGARVLDVVTRRDPELGVVESVYYVTK